VVLCSRIALRLGSYGVVGLWTFYVSLQMNRYITKFHKIPLYYSICYGCNVYTMACNVCFTL
jgi:hypothetical protein